MQVSPRVPKVKAKTPYDLPERVRWYHILWEMRKGEFRRSYISMQRRHWRIFLKYESHLIYERAVMGLLAATVIYALSNLNIVKAVVRLPTEDINELLKEDVWQGYRNEVNQRKEHANKMLEESAFIRDKNKPFSS
ncbi:uncharacterized protein TEOVI_000912900 [Trypanosoma equiperdum]|uniref:Uncharacterized protein n=2 Tax=Trypanozoon TaxID=39700 RepID=Q57W64_TRYB2|nr:hypothetical protein, conserved [Trypanosoma brucei brucei TREU927]AAX70155.1 hypothetical protein, conserved [Trypanosoma brucei]AAZ13074.1 hypothetical protein, conserved [Trypanosoma brucei brucei TREU927]SCU66111.1 hypothetical protein, conserved [Trypanosoma equiperdum]